MPIGYRLYSVHNQTEDMALTRNKGFTLLELMIAVTIIAIIAAMAGPSVSGFIDKQKIINATEAVYSQLQFARSQAISRSAEVHASFGYADSADKSTWLMSVSTRAGCDITKTIGTISDDCTMVVSDGLAGLDPGDGTVDPNDLVYFVTSGADFNGVMIDANSTGTGGAPNEITFNPTRGTAELRTIYLWFDGGNRQYEMRVIIGAIGRVRLCTPEGARQVPGYTTTIEPTGCS